jgi:cellulose synthase/poly-beta-1,6-N-acetylglucosamine synthase-like glycosyltransferase
LPGKARNIGISSSRSEIIVHLDASCTVEPGWLNHLISPILDNNANFVTGRISPMPAPSKWLWFKHDLGPLFYSMCNWTPRSDKFPAGGCSVAYRKYVWELAGGMPEWLRIGEDVIFSRRLQNLPVRFAYANDSVCYWQAGPGLVDALRRKYRYILADISLYPFPAHLKKAMIRSAFVVGSVVLPLFMGYKGLTAVALFLIYTTYNSIKFVQRYIRFKSEHRQVLPFPVIIFAAPILLMAIYSVELAGMVMGIFLLPSRISSKKLIQNYLSVQNNDTEEIVLSGYKAGDIS